MKTHKICKRLLNSVSSLSLKKQRVFVYSTNFDETKLFLDKFNYHYTTFRFAKCFSLDADFDDLNILSENQNVDFIYSNLDVKIGKFENKFISLNNLTKNKFLGNNQTICFIDTGIFPHIDFILPKNRIIKFIDLINNQQTPYDDNGHGTFVSGVCSGGGILNKDYSGFAPLSNIIMIKALNKDGNSDSNRILDAMQWIYNNHKKYKIGVVCMSFGADFLNKSDPLSFGAEALWKCGLIVVAAAGNSGPKSQTIKSPGNSPKIITVGALDMEHMKIADFSSRGPTPYGHKPDLIAPAVDLISCSNSYLPYTTMSGTSVATPIIAGICADLKSKYPNITNESVKRFLIKNCKKLEGKIDTEGAGYIDFSNLYLD